MQYNDPKKLCVIRILDKPLRKMRNLLLSFLLISLLYGCIDCGPQEELVAGINIYGDSLKLINVHALGATDQHLFLPLNQLNNNPSGYFDFPISLHADSTTYIFEFENRIDTLTLFYKRVFYYRKGCGFVVDAEIPDNYKSYNSTFKKVNVQYTSYIYEGRVTLFNGGGKGGINVGIQL